VQNPCWGLVQGRSTNGVMTRLGSICPAEDGPLCRSAGGDCRAVSNFHHGHYGVMSTGLTSLALLVAMRPGYALRS